MSDAVFYTVVFVLLAILMASVAVMYVWESRQYKQRTTKGDDDMAEMLRLQGEILAALRSRGWQDNRRIDVHVQQPRPNGSIQHR